MRDAKQVRWLIVQLCFLVPVTAWAQSTGSIAGVVKDSSGAVLPGVTVEVASPALIEKVREGVTDGVGRYSIVDLRPGTYAVTATLPGFNTFRREGVELSAGFTATIDAVLQVGAIEQTVTVSGATPVVDVQSTRTQTVLERAQVDDIPNARTFNTYVALIPGVKNTNTLGGRDVGGTAGEPPYGLAVHGSDAGLTTIDGIVTVAVETPSIHKMNPNALAMQETVVETGNGSAEAWTGGVNVSIISKDGGNRFSGTFAGDYSGKGLDANNLDSSLEARGLHATNRLKEIYDVGGAFGGPLIKDKLWFFMTPRRWVSQEYAAGIYQNVPSLQHTPFYTPDLSNQATFGKNSYNYSGRVTWQAAQKDKITFQANSGYQCFCDIGPDFGTIASAGRDYFYAPQRLFAANWTSPVTSRLLLEAGGAYRVDDNMSRPTSEAGVLATDIPVTDVGRGISYGNDSGCCTISLFGTHPAHHWITHGSLSYVTGSHAFKTGWTTTYMQQIIDGTHPPVQYIFNNGTPIGLNEFAVPVRLETQAGLVGLFAQDRWTIHRLTANLGVRFDYVNASSPAQIRPAGVFTPAIPEPAVNNLPDWKDINPRIGVTYDLFGNGRTALKVSLGRYEQSNNYGVVLARNANPQGQLAVTTTRTWTPTGTPASNPNYYSPECDLQDPQANGVCGAIANQKFGGVVPATTYAPDLLQGWGVSPYIWEGQVGLQQQLAPNVGLTAGYYRTWYGNLWATNNVATAAADYSPYCVTAPLDQRLAGGGGNQICQGLYDVSPAKFGQVSNVVDLAPNQSEIYNGVDAFVTARLGGGYAVSAGIDSGQTVANFCANLIVQTQFCNQTLPWRGQTEFKLNGIFPLPWWGLQLSGSYQNLPGTPQGGNYFALPGTGVTEAFSNSQIAPSLGRNLAACPPTGPCTTSVVLSIVPPNTLFEARQNQLDVRLTKVFKYGPVRLRANIDVFNLLNINSVLALQTRYGQTFLTPQSILPGRFIKFGTQVDF